MLSNFQPPLKDSEISAQAQATQTVSEANVSDVPLRSSSVNSRSGPSTPPRVATPVLDHNGRLPRNYTTPRVGSKRYGRSQMITPKVTKRKRTDSVVLSPFKRNILRFRDGLKVSGRGHRGDTVGWQFNVSCRYPGQ